MATNNGTNQPQLTANGQLLIGSAGVNPVAATLTAGTGMGVTNAAGAITVNIISNEYAQGRLTLTSNTPVTTTDVTAATTIYFTPYKGNYITLYTAGAWKLYQFTQVSLVIPNAASQMYDIFLYDNAGTLTLEAVSWTNDTTRATALATQDGVYCKTAALDRRYLGSFRTTTVAGQCEDSLVKRYVWNYYNRIEKTMLARDATASWNYTTSTFRQANANAANQLDMVIGVLEDQVKAYVNGSFQSSTTTVGATVGIGLNSTSVNSSQSWNGAISALGATYIPVTAAYVGWPGTGRSTLVWLEYSVAAGTTTWQGQNPNFGYSGIYGNIFC